MMLTIFSILVLMFFILLAGMAIIPVFFGAPWHPLSDENINRIIKFASLRPGEKFYDLGSGDGRVLIAASKKRFVRGVGVEIDPIKVLLSKYLILTGKLTNKISIHRGNMFDFDVSDADVIYLYLTHQALDRLFPEILDRMKPSARIICYRFCVRNLEPAKINKDNNLFLYNLTKGRTVNKYS
ncbi:MAG: class I SAM-dependent methyltransferase [Nitrospina sp.]|nr:class I SAM-dependent methyltransferase [Nitrospina sp.]MBT6601390.1 class I SAM-dependent methyltransferase [Nitrospina sp.]